MTTPPLLAFHGDPSVKAKYLDRVEAHRKADNLVQGYGYWEDGKGCAVGCTLEANGHPHDRYPIELGLPEWLAHLEDHLFEHLPKEDARKWPSQFLEAIPVGVEIPDSIRDEFQVFWLERQISQIDTEKYPGVESAVSSVIDLMRKAIKGDEPDPAAWSAARSAAESAAWSAARSAARSAAWSAARSAAWSAARSAAESAARSAAESAAESAAWSAAESAAWSEAIVKRDWLLTALSNLPAPAPTP